jgi:hypothetical protein
VQRDAVKRGFTASFFYDVSMMKQKTQKIQNILALNA